jgi:hypothetical protein
MKEVTSSGPRPQASTRLLMADDYCPVCGRPEDFCEVCGGPHNPLRQHARVPGEEVQFTREDVDALAREAEAWEGSVEYMTVEGIRAHAERLRSLADRITLLLPQNYL